MEQRKGFERETRSERTGNRTTWKGEGKKGMPLIPGGRKRKREIDTNIKSTSAIKKIDGQIDIDS